MKILLINGGAPFNGNGGKLSKTLHELAKRTLESLGHETRETTIHEGYDLEGEVEKFLWMDAVIWQMPAWWMGEPWIVKKYIDEVFMSGMGKIVANDGRHSASPNDGYGTGGLIKGKSHMQASLGIRRFRRLTSRVIFSRAWAWTAFICIFIKQMSF